VTVPATRSGSASAASATHADVKTPTIPRPASTSAPYSGDARASLPGWASTGDGKAIYDWLVKHGSTDDAATQEILITEWSTFMIEARLTLQNFPRQKVVFPNSSSAEDVIDRMTALLDLYEKVPEHRAAPAHIFIKVMVQLLSEDVPSLGDWGKRFIIDLLTGNKSITCTRSAWVADEASKLIRAILPQRSLAFASTRHEGHQPGTLNV